MCELPYTDGCPSRHIFFVALYYPKFSTVPVYERAKKNLQAKP